LQLHLEDSPYRLKPDELSISFHLYSDLISASSFEPWFGIGARKGPYWIQATISSRYLHHTCKAFLLSDLCSYHQLLQFIGIISPL